MNTKRTRISDYICNYKWLWMIKSYTKFDKKKKLIFDIYILKIIFTLYNFYAFEM